MRVKDPGKINYYDYIDSKYRLVHICVERAKQLIEGAKTMVKTKSIKPTTIALEEFLEGKLEFKRGEEIKEDKEKLTF